MDQRLPVCLCCLCCYKLLITSERKGPPQASSALSAYLCALCVERANPTQRTQRYAENAEFQISESSTAEVSFCSWGSGSPGTRYSPSTHRPRSTSWHRSEQKGRKGLSFHSIGLPQVGHFIELEPRARPTSQRDAGRLISIRRLTNAIVPSRRMAFKRTVTLSRVEPTIEAISRWGRGISMSTPSGSETP